MERLGRSLCCCYDGLAKRERLVEQAPGAEASRGFEPRSLDSEFRVLTVTPWDQLLLLPWPSKHNSLGFVAAPSNPNKPKPVVVLVALVDDEVKQPM